MSKSLLSILIFLVVAAAASTAALTPAPATASGFIKSSCRSTTYPTVCVQSLSIYASTIQKSRRQLAQTALTVSLAKAQSATTYMTQLAKTAGLKPREKGVMKDCVEEMNDTADRLSKSIKELKSTGRASGPDFLWHLSNVQTWVSAALTDDNTCFDEARDLNPNLRNLVRTRVTNVMQVTSNGLALVNTFAAQH